MQRQKERFDAMVARLEAKPKTRADVNSEARSLYDKLHECSVVTFFALQRIVHEAYIVPSLEQCFDVDDFELACLDRSVVSRCEFPFESKISNRELAVVGDAYLTFYIVSTAYERPDRLVADDYQQLRTRWSSDRNVAQFFDDYLSPKGAAFLACMAGRETTTSGFTKRQKATYVEALVGLLARVAESRPIANLICKLICETEKLQLEQ